MSTREEIIVAIRSGHNDRDAFDAAWLEEEGDGFLSGQLDLAHVLLGEAPYDYQDTERLIEEIREGWL